MNPPANRQAGIDVFNELANGVRHLLRELETVHSHLQSPLPLDHQHLEQGRKVLLKSASVLLGSLPEFAEKAAAASEFLGAMTDQQWATCMEDQK